MTAHSVVNDSVPVLAMAGVSKSYRNGQETTRVLDDLTLELRRGEITCLVGPSGGGKSTIIALIAGLLLADSGRIRVSGRPLDELSDRQRSELRATRLGIVLQSGNLVPFLTVSENIALAVRLAGRPRSDALGAALLDRVGLADRAGHLPRRLSGGEAQRVALAVALANRPELLLADEAVGQLDSATARAVISTLQEECRENGLAVLLVTHDQAVAGPASRTVRLQDGRLLEGAR